MLRQFFADEIGRDGALLDRLAAESAALFVSVAVRKSQFGLRPRAPRVAAGVTPRAPFDPFAIGLVPVFQREGRAGLLAQLSEIADAGHLRQMARAQQIALDEGMGSGAAPTDELCRAIADAVERRIADRRAAAG